MGLLVLRIAIGLTGTVQGALILGDASRSTLESEAGGLVLVTSGLLVLIGFLTPIASVLQALAVISLGLSWTSPPLAGLFAGPLAVILLVAIAVALAFLGPGYLSVDSRMFGRREIIIPRLRRPAS